MCRYMFLYPEEYVLGVNKDVSMTLSQWIVCLVICIKSYLFSKLSFMSGIYICVIITKWEDYILIICMR